MKKFIFLVGLAFSFLSQTALAGYGTLSALNRSFISGRKVFVNIGYSSSEKESFDNCKNIEIGVLTYKNYLRHGYSFLFGWEKFYSDGIRKIDFTYNFLLQFPYIGANREILAVGNNFTLVPFFGVAPGIGLRTDNFPDIKKFSDTGDWFRDTIENYVVMRVKGGFDLTVAPGLSFEFLISKNLTMDKATSYFAGVNLDF
ncbi:hypothetical protein [Desulfurobacterium atlanticum]|uniref:Outer membrane protein beta-barrel domain-containing protein n=1 Tax=Desulfurobacterium atlanticum TaxID=240169 RepID=A0A239AC74_9BACT|nr:hypothetical protein [Desulfurobacterium atlanticum]SNR93227.1 hypothetical protein SAMN06265340_1197 [Desulfurobacterium atlanticum]